jgi:hypothetical protein
MTIPCLIPRNPQLLQTFLCSLLLLESGKYANSFVERVLPLGEYLGSFVDAALDGGATLDPSEKFPHGPGDSVFGNFCADCHSLRTVADRRAAVEGEAALTRADDHARSAGTAAQYPQSGEQPLRPRTTAARDGYTLRSPPRLGVDDRWEGVLFDEVAEAELSEQHPRAEKRLRTVVAAPDPVLAQVAADLGDRLPSSPQADGLRNDPGLSLIELDRLVLASAKSRRQVREGRDTAGDRTALALDSALGGDAAVVLGDHAEHCRGEPPRSGVSTNLADVDGQDPTAGILDTFEQFPLHGQGWHKPIEERDDDHLGLPCLDQSERARQVRT